MRYMLKNLNVCDSKEILYGFLKLSTLIFYGGIAYAGSRIASYLMNSGLKSLLETYYELFWESMILVCAWGFLVVVTKYGVVEDLEEVSRNERKVKTLDNVRKRYQENRYQR